MPCAVVGEGGAVLAGVDGPAERGVGAVVQRDGGDGAEIAEHPADPAVGRQAHAVGRLALDLGGIGEGRLTADLLLVELAAGLAGLGLDEHVAVLRAEDLARWRAGGRGRRCRWGGLGGGVERLGRGWEVRLDTGVRAAGGGAVDRGLAAGERGDGQHPCRHKPRVHLPQPTQHVTCVTGVTRGRCRCTHAAARDAPCLRESAVTVVGGALQRRWVHFRGGRPVRSHGRECAAIAALSALSRRWARLPGNKWRRWPVDTFDS